MIAKLSIGNGAKVTRTIILLPLSEESDRYHEKFESHYKSPGLYSNSKSSEYETEKRNKHNHNIISFVDNKCDP
jgi:hypothetical protein